jgi:hypothetical protein
MLGHELNKLYKWIIVVDYNLIIQKLLMKMRDSLASLKQKVIQKKRQQQNELNRKKQAEINNQIHELIKEIETENIATIKDKYERKIRLLLESIKTDRVLYHQNLRGANHFAKLDHPRPKSSTRPESNDQFILRDLSFDSTPKKAPCNLSTFQFDKEMSIRELQFQQKMEEIKRLEQMNDSLLEELDKKKYVCFQEVLVRPDNKHIHRSLSQYNRRENRSVERIARTNSPFKSRGDSKPPLPYQPAKKLRPSPTFEIATNCVYLTEKEENFKWNEITSKQLEEQVRNSIQEVDKVLKLRNFSDLVKSVSVNTESKPNLPVEHEENTCHTPSPRASFKRFRQLLKTNNLIVDDKAHTPTLERRESRNGPLVPYKTSNKSNSETETKDDYFMPQSCLSPNLRYRQKEDNTAVSSHDNKIIITDEFEPQIDEDDKEDTPEDLAKESENQTSMKEDSI